MNKRFLAIAIAAGLASPFAASADVTTYGLVHASVGTVDTGASDNFQYRSHASRLGFKGSEDLGNGLSATYKLEYGVSTDTGGWTNRNQYVGLKGGFGEFRFGRHDTPMKMAQGKFDQFGDTDADIIGANTNTQPNLALVGGDQRVANALAYINKFGDITLGVALVPGEGNGTTTGGDGIADTTSIAAMYDAGPLFVSLAIDSYDDTAGGLAATLGREDLTRLVATYKMGTMQFGLLFESEGTASGTGENDVTGLSFGMGMGKNKVKFQYMMGDDDTNEVTQTSLGYDWGLSKRTTTYVMWTDAEAESGGATTDEYTFIGAGIVHKF